MDRVKNNIIDLADYMGPSELEKEYIGLYGEEFVADLRSAYYKMIYDMRKQPSHEDIIKRRNHCDCERITIYFVDFHHENFISQTIDSNGGKTIQNWGKSPRLKTHNDHHLRYLLSGLYATDRQKGDKWRIALLGRNGKIWCGNV